MDAYLEIAERILRGAKRPLTARQIIENAYIEKIVPSQLHGRTQHKTLGARLSEDILLHRERSVFFRTSPGRFFLRTFLADPTVPEEFRTPMIARRRRRELLQGKILTLPSSALPAHNDGECVPTDFVLNALIQNEYRYVSASTEKAPQELGIWAFVMVTRGKSVLTYRHGRYREDRDAFLKRRSVGFFTPVIDQDNDLFDKGDRGIVAAGLKAVILDLDLPYIGGGETDYQKDTRLECFFDVESPDGTDDLLALLRFECPTWFEPLRRRLAINDLNWMDMFVPVNNFDDFDPWSQKVLEWAQRA